MIKRKVKEKIKNLIILVLIVALVWTWYGEEIQKSFRKSFTGASIKDYSLKQGWEEGSPFLGATDAPVKMIIFSDFQCPFCKKFHEETFPQIKEEYVKTGKIKIIFKHLPLSFHPLAESAALASLCAGEQGKFWLYQDKLFENQKKLSQQYFRNLAKKLNLNYDQFINCLRKKTFLPQINSDKKAAAQAGLQGTPSFLINDEKIVGALPFSKFKEVIDRKLNQKKEG